jgi:hypothetical protein
MKKEKTLKINKTIVLVLTLVFSIFLSVEKSLADDTKDQKIGIAIDKTVFDFDLLPEEETSFKLQIENNTSERQIVSVDFRDIVINDQNKIDLIVDRNEVFGLKDWISFSGDNENIGLEAGEKREVELNLSVPEDAIVGSHYGLVLFKSFPQVNFDNFQNTLVGGEIGVYVFCNVEGEISGKGLIEKTEMPRIVDEQEELKVTFRNIGNVHYIPHGGITAKNVLTGESESYELDKHFVFPGKSYNFSYQWDVPSVFGIYSVQAFFVDQEGQNLSKTKLIFGKYSLLIVVILLAVLFLIFREIRNRIKIFRGQDNLEQIKKEKV